MRSISEVSVPLNAYQTQAGCMSIDNGILGGSGTSRRMTPQKPSKVVSSTNGNGRFKTVAN